MHILSRMAARCEFQLTQRIRMFTTDYLTMHILQIKFHMTTIIISGQTEERDEVVVGILHHARFEPQHLTKLHYILK
jgi:hypothetical protein